MPEKTTDHPALMFILILYSLTLHRTRETYKHNYAN